MFNILENTTIEDFEKAYASLFSNNDAWIIKNGIQIKNIPYKLPDVDVLRINNEFLKSIVNIPNNINVLTFYTANSLVNVDLSKVNIHEHLGFQTCRGLQSVILSNTPDIHIEQCYKLTKITAYENIGKLKIKKCDGIKSLSCIDIPFVDTLNIEYTNITDFLNQNIHTNKLLIRCEKITSFSGIEDIDVRTSLTLSRIMKVNNLACCMLTPAKILKVHTPDAFFVNKQLVDLFKKYEKDENRRESVMDVVVWLLDNGFEKAAEI